MKRWNIPALCFLAVLMVLSFFLSGCSRGGGVSSLATGTDARTGEISPPPLPPQPVSLGTSPKGDELDNGTALSTTLSAGWTSISFPFDSLTSTDGFRYLLYQWDGTQYQMVDPRNASGIDCSKGYFAYTDYPDTVTADGPYSRSITSVPLHTGWNFFAFPRRYTMPFSQVTLTYGAQTKSLGEATNFTNTPPAWGYARIYTCDGGAWTQLRCDNRENSLQQWKGYWIYCWVDGAILNLDPILVLNSVSPASGRIAGGDPVTLKGLNFLPGATVTFGVVSATDVVVVDDTTITCTTPPHVPGPVDVTLTNPPGVQVTLTDGFTYTVSILMEFITIAAGNFTMGSSNGEGDPDEEPRHTVHLDAYDIGKYEVTNAQYAVFVALSDYAAEGDWQNAGGSLTGYAGSYPNSPVISVTWNDAKAFCDYYGYRLPTEAEWEKAARGTDTRTYPWGNTWDQNLCNNWDGPLTGNKANILSGRGTLPVGYLPSGASPYECMDMAGNVWEWCQDWYGATYYSSSPSSNPQGPVSGTERVLRGGAWSDSGAGVFRCAIRHSNDPVSWVYNLGFRCARGVP